MAQNDWQTARAKWQAFIHQGAANLPVLSASNIDKFTHAFKTAQQLPAEKAYFSGTEMIGHGEAVTNAQLALAAQAPGWSVLKGQTWLRKPGM